VFPGFSATTMSAQTVDPAAGLMPRSTIGPDSDPVVPDEGRPVQISIERARRLAVAAQLLSALRPRSFLEAWKASAACRLIRPAPSLVRNI
jgi:hypothetical protein